jgi:elongator complex protein 3
MPGLPGSTPEKDLEMSAQLFSDDRFRPDGLKIYPTMVVEGTELEKWYRDGRYVPYSNETMTGLVAGIKALVPGYVRISRVLRDIPANYIVGGLKDSLRGVVREKMEQEGTACRCIRCREYGHRARAGREIGEPGLVRFDYEAAGGREVFLSFEDEDETLFGLLRMRIQPGQVERLEEAAAGKTALIRELHIYGPEVPLSSQSSDGVQHRGLGRALLSEAERIAGEEFRAESIAILSGVGARDYYRSESGYALKADYMVKRL